MKKLTINRRRWIYGQFHTAQKSSGEDHFCAIGWVRESVGLPRDYSKWAFPEGPTTSRQEAVDYTARKLVAEGLEWLVCPVKDPTGAVTDFNYSAAACEIWNANDYPYYDKEGKAKRLTPGTEKRLTALFAEHGIDLVFEN